MLLWVLILAVFAALMVFTAITVAAAFVDLGALNNVVMLAIAVTVLDGADGWLARRSGVSSAFGARFDGEVDAFLILALSVAVAPTYGM